MKLYDEVSGAGKYVLEFEQSELQEIIDLYTYFIGDPLFDDSEDEDEMTALGLIIAQLASIIAMDRMIKRAESGRVADMLAEHFGSEA